jgi:hypothetical protein
VRRGVSAFVAIFLLFGGMVLVLDALSKADNSQTPKMLGGATCVSLALVYGWLLLASWIKSRKLLKLDESE